MLHLESNENKFTLALSNLDQEISVESLPVTGTVPAWLSGTLFRNGPAKFSMGNGAHTHWFDGLAMVHKYGFHEGRVSYTNRYLRTDAYEVAMRTGVIGSNFGGNGEQQGKNNTNVNIAKISDRFVAMTETIPVVEFDPHNLNTLCVLSYDDEMPGHITTAHPHYDARDGVLYNFNVEFGRVSQYHVYRIEPGTKKRILIGSVETELPSYMHSFAVTENYILLVEFPLVINPILMMQPGGGSFLEKMEWLPERGTRFLVMSKRDGKVVSRYESEAFFSFHHVNAFEKDGEIIVDLSASDRATVVKSLYIDKFITNNETNSQFRRYRLPQIGTTAHVELLSNETIELPTINRQHAMREYRYAYGISNNRQRREAHANQLMKADIKTGITKLWAQEGCYPGEPVFVAHPQGRVEDEGVVLSGVFDSKMGRSFLLVLDSSSFEEIARAIVPHHVPFGFHGLFTNERFEKGGVQ